MSEKNINCEIVKDLLPLYHDNVVSDTTAIAVEEHLENCEDCSREYDSLCTELSENLSSEKKGVKALLKRIKHKGLIKGIIIAVLCVAVLISSFDVLTQVPLKKLSEDKVYATRVYKCEGVFFVFYNQKLVPYSAKEVLNENGKELDISIKTPVIDFKSFFESKEEKSKIHEMNWITDNCYKNVDKLTLNGKEIWSEQENGDDKIPDYIKEFVYYPITFGKEDDDNEESIFSFGENQTSYEFNNNNESCKLTFDHDKKQVSIEYGDGSRKIWNLDGKLISDNSVSKN